MSLHAIFSCLGLTRQSPQPRICALPGCGRPCCVENGRAHNFCCRSHALQHQQTSTSVPVLLGRTNTRGATQRQASGPRPAARPRFDGTREYTSDGLVLFWQPPSVFSQWTPSRFVVEDVAYTCAEQYMMAEKARLFGDADIWRQIMATEDPRAHKKLGRVVGGYDQGVWDQHKKDIVTRGSYAKFTQNYPMGQHLLDTGEKLLAEASPLDPVWGIGLRADNPAARNPASWRGQNLLGQALQDVRARMVAERW